MADDSVQDAGDEFRRRLVRERLGRSIDPEVVGRDRGNFPGKVEAPDLNATGNEVPIEPIELETESPEDADPDDQAPPAT